MSEVTGMREHLHHDELSRRSFLKALGASLAFAGLDGCTRIPAEKIIPYVTQPPEFTPGLATHYATSMVLDGYATGLIVEAHEGRPTKIEGNPEHPASLGASGILEQASLLQLYDPDRATRIRNGSSPSSWEALAAAFAPATLRNRVGTRGAGLAILLEPTSSPLIATQLDALRAMYPEARVCFYAPLRATPLDAVLGTRGLVAHYDLRNADVILSAGSDFLASGPFNLRYARDFADRRRSPASGMNRLYVAEHNYTVTGGAADHRLAVAPDALERMLESVLAAVRGEAGNSNEWSDAVGADLKAHAGRSLVIAGDTQPPRVHALAIAINNALQNIGKAVWFTHDPVLGAGDLSGTVASLATSLESGSMDTLVCIGGNPSYTTPRPLHFSSLVHRVPRSVYVGLYENETARDVTWFVPAAHYLEAWGDARAYDGTYSLVQPLVRPLHGGKSATELLALLLGQPALDVRAAVRAISQNGAGPGDDEWNAALGRGFIAGPSLTSVTAAVRPELLAPIAGSKFARDSVTVILDGDARVHDGSFANNGWLQELPDPITKLTWGNAARLSSGTAARLAVATGDVVELSHDGVAVRAPALIVPGHADDVVALSFGYGRTGAETVARGVGVNVYALLPAEGERALRGAAITKHGTHRDLAITQSHWSMEGRGQARSTTLADYVRGPTPTEPRRHRSLTIYDPPPRLNAPQQWAMTIDLGTCIGCSACVVACQAENNIPVVGPEDVAKSREMHWLRIDRYIEGSADDPRTITQPMLCQHCENAPCEYVCPVGATVHSQDGLNEMVYNRCVGTRFCSNNCPYKVRRFNWFDYNARLSETEQMAKNPDVTVRERGVMEKCTFCVQRIREAEIAAGVDGHLVRGGDVKTACQQACPTNAIVFGSLTDRDSPVVKLREDARAYAVLDELGTVPRVEYLARIRNINPRLKSGA